MPAASSARQMLSSMGSMAVQSRCYLGVGGVNTVNQATGVSKPASLLALDGLEKRTADSNWQLAIAQLPAIVR